MIRPAKLNLTIVSGDAWRLPFSFAIGDVSDRTYRAKISVSKDGAASGDVAFTVDDSDAATGTIALSLTAEQTDALTVNGSYWWDLEETTGDGPRTIINGYVTVGPKVTH